MHGPLVLLQIFEEGTLEERLFQTAVVLVGAVLVYLILLLVGRRMMKRFERDEIIDQRERRYITMWSFLRRIILVVVLILGILGFMAVWGVSLAPLIAVGGAIGVAVGFGAQNFIRDVIAGFLILAENQYRIGDVVDIVGVRGKVEDIQVRLTVLRDGEGNVHYVPNGLIEVTSNLTQEYAQAVIDLGIDYEADVDRALEIIRDELERFAADPRWSGVVIEEPKVMGVQELGDSAVVIRSVIRVEAEKRHPVRRELLRRFKNRMDAEGIGIPFPTQTLYVTQGE